MKNVAKISRNIFWETIIFVGIKIKINIFNQIILSHKSSATRSKSNFQFFIINLNLVATRWRTALGVGLCRVIPVATGVSAEAEKCRGSFAIVTNKQDRHFCESYRKKIFYIPFRVLRRSASLVVIYAVFAAILGCHFCCLTIIIKLCSTPKLKHLLEYHYNLDI